MEKKSNRVGLSEYTARRLAELRARRAEADDTGGISIGTSSSTAAEASVSDSVSTIIPPPVTTQNSTTPTPCSRSAADSNTTAQVLPATQLPMSNDLPSSLNVPKTASPGISAPAPAVSNGIADGLPSTADVMAMHKQLWNEKSQLSSSTEQRRMDRQELSSAGPATETSKPPVQRREIPQPSPFTRIGSRSNDATAFSGSAVEVGTLSKLTEDPCIGFSNLPEQLHRKAVKKGFDFTVMVVGDSGLGKSTLISNLFCKHDLYGDRTTPEVSVSTTVGIEKRFVEIEDHGIKLRLTVVDTPGFNDMIDALQCFKPIADYVEKQFEQYYENETGFNRHNIKDTRVHCCLYFIPPHGHGLRPIDVELMRQLQAQVNIVPVIGKADTLTSCEVRRLKAQVMMEIKKNNLRVYELPPCDEDEDENFKAKDKQMKESWPFAVIGANCTIEVGGRRVRGRVYPWGVVEAENPQHSDFSKLQQFLMSTHLHDLKDVTCDVHYENFRVSRIRHQQSPTSVTGPIVDNTEKLLRQKEEEIKRMQQMMQHMQSQLSSTQQQQQQQQQMIKSRHANGPL